MLTCLEGKWEGKNEQPRIAELLPALSVAARSQHSLVFRLSVGVLYYSKPITKNCFNATCNFKLNAQLILNTGIKLFKQLFLKKGKKSPLHVPFARCSKLPLGFLTASRCHLSAPGRRPQSDARKKKKSLCAASLVSVLKKLNAGTSWIHRHSLLPLKKFSIV